MAKPEIFMELLESMFPPERDSAQEYEAIVNLIDNEEAALRDFKVQVIDARSIRNQVEDTFVQEANALKDTIYTLQSLCQSMTAVPRRQHEGSRPVDGFDLTARIAWEIALRYEPEDWPHTTFRPTQAWWQELAIRLLLTFFKDVLKHRMGFFSQMFGPTEGRRRILLDDIDGRPIIGRFYVNPLSRRAMSNDSVSCEDDDAVGYSAYTTVEPAHDETQENKEEESGAGTEDEDENEDEDEDGDHCTVEDCFESDKESDESHHKISVPSKSIFATTQYHVQAIAAKKQIDDMYAELNDFLGLEEAC